MLIPHPADAQLRPLDPVDFHVLEGERFRLQLGSGVYFDQHASLTGTRGRLTEIGDVRVAWSTRRVTIEVAGAIQRLFREDSVVQAPFHDVEASTSSGKRHDAGDYRVQTVVRLTSDSARTTAIVRFGTRLPTTNNRVGLERDQTDFFASLGAHRAHGALHAAAEAGISINGTRLSHYEQSDVLIYALTIERRGAIVSPYVSVVGQEDFHDTAPRGNEDLGEVRGGVRIGQRRWINAMFVRGFREHSPSAGLAIAAGFSLR